MDPAQGGAGVVGEGLVGQEEQRRRSVSVAFPFPPGLAGGEEGLSAFLGAVEGGGEVDEGDVEPLDDGAAPGAVLAHPRRHLAAVGELLALAHGRDGVAHGVLAVKADEPAAEVGERSQQDRGSTTDGAVSFYGSPHDVEDRGPTTDGASPPPPPPGGFSLFWTNQEHREEPPSPVRVDLRAPRDVADLDRLDDVDLPAQL